MLIFNDYGITLYSLRSFGCVLYELFTLNKLFAGEYGFGIIRSIVEEPIPIIEESEPLFQPIIEKYLDL